MPAKKLVLLSMVAVRPPGGRFATVAVPPRLSASAITAPPCSVPKRLLCTSRTGISATTLSLETWVIFMPMKSANGGWNSASGFIMALKTKARPIWPRPHHQSRDSNLWLPRLRHHADVGLRRLPTARIKLLGFFVAHRAGEDDG